MAGKGRVVVIGGTSDIGKQIARRYASKGYPTVVTSRDEGRAKAAVQDVSQSSVGLSLDIGNPHSIASALAAVDDVIHLVLVSILRDENSVRDYNIESALNLVTMKLVGYTEVIHVLAPRMRENGSIVLFGGLAKDHPYVGSTTVTSVNGGVTSMIGTLALELAPIRVNAIHPAVVGDSPYWANKPPEVLAAIRARMPGADS